MNNTNNNLEIIAKQFVGTTFNFSDEPDKKVVLVGKEIKSLTPQEIERIENEKEKGLPFEKSLRVIVGVVKNMERNELNSVQRLRLSKNILWLNSKIEEHNKRIAENTFKNVLDKIITFLTRGHYSLKYRLLQEPLLSTTQSQIIEELVKREPELSKNSQLQALETLYTHEDIIPPEDFLKTLIYVRENLDLMKQGTIGTVARSREGIIKIKATHYPVPYDLEYHKETGDIVVHLGKLGEGTYKVVKKSLFISSSELRLQALAKQETKVGDLSEREVKFLHETKHCQHVIKLHDVRVYTSQKKTEELQRQGVQTSYQVQALWFPLYEMGDLEQLLNNPNLDQKAKLRIALDIIEGIQELHQLGIIHRDIKPLNIFLKKDENGILRAFVADLGISCYDKGDPMRDKPLGSLLYMPPEHLKLSPEPSHFGSDTWAFGVLLSRLLKGSSPFDNVNSAFKHSKVIRELEPVPSPNKNENPIDYVIWKLLRPKKSERMDLNDAFSILNTEWNKLI